MDTNKPLRRPGDMRPTIRSAEMSDRHTRVYGQDPMTGSIRSRAASLVDSTDEIVQEDTVTLAAGADHLFEVLVASQSQDHLTVTVETALYIGSADAANVLPGGSAVTEADWQVMGPKASLLKADGTEAKSYERCFQIYVRNAGAGPQDVILRYRISYIANRGNALA